MKTVTPNSDALTYYFSDIFKSSDDFIDTMETICIWKRLSSTPIMEKLYNHISRHYHNVNVRYSRADDFVVALAEVIDNCFYQLSQQWDITNRVYQLQWDELQEVGRSLNSFADAPNTEQSMDEPLNYVTNQAQTIQKQGMLQSFLQYLDSLRPLDVQKLLRESGLDNLFMAVIPSKETIF